MQSGLKGSDLEMNCNNVLEDYGQRKKDNSSSKGAVRTTVLTGQEGHLRVMEGRIRVYDCMALLITFLYSSKAKQD